MYSSIIRIYVLGNSMAYHEIYICKQTLIITIMLTVTKYSCLKRL